MTFVELILINLIICSSIMTGLWFVSKWLNYYSLVDVAWAYGIGFTVLVSALLLNSIIEKEILVGILVGLWSLRLGTHLLMRLRQHWPQEDSRYSTLKTTWSDKKFFIFFQFQALSQVAFALPFFLILADNEFQFSFISIVGISLYAIGLIGETLADYQLNQFKKFNKDSNAVFSHGLWKYSRHPNYFFEWLVWCGIAIVAMGAQYGFIGIISPALMFFTLNYLTGIPATESQSLKSKGKDYQNYQSKTNRFFLGVPK